LVSPFVSVSGALGTGGDSTFSAALLCEDDRPFVKDLVLLTSTGAVSFTSSNVSYQNNYRQHNPRLYLNVT
jgi:hypothetical protein